MHEHSFAELHSDDLFRNALEVLIRASPKMKTPRCRAVFEALCRTRTGDPFLTMEVLYQLS